jgi:ABC-type multidrug transport system fused ATPase/permease subunit
MQTFWTFARRMLRYRWLVAAAMVFALLSAGGLGAGLLGMKPVLDNILGAGGKAARTLPEIVSGWNSELPGWSPKVPQGIIDSLPTKPFDAVLWIMVALGALTMIGAACNFMHAYLSLTVISRTIANIRREAFHRVIHLPLKTVLQSGPSDLVSRIVYDTAALGAGFNALLSRAVAQVTKGIAAMAAAFWFDWRLAGAALLIAPALAIVIRKLGKRIRRASRSALEGQAGLYLAAGEALGGLRVVKVHANERAEAGRFHKINKRVVAQEFKVRTARALASPLIETLTLFILGSLAVIAIKTILDHHLDPETFIMVLGSLGIAGASLKPLTGLLNDIQQASAAATRLGELLALPTEPGHDRTLPKLPPVRETIEFDNVGFGYPGAASPALRGVSLSIPHGATYAFVGPNGCGKTTLLSLIPRLFDPEQGRVVIDGRDIREFNIRSLRKQIGVVTQDTVLFRGTIADNIAYGASGLGDGAAEMEKIRSAARMARAEEFILAKPNGYDFEIGEQGAGLSGGQRQRIAIARAMLRDPAILILDEATSMVDAESEARIAEAVAEFVSPRGRDGAARSRTCLIVAHRLSTVLAADQIVVMDDGRILDRGKHSELLGRCDLYRSLVSNQLMKGDGESGA